jgi:nucleoside-diphosphate-sugar epimerase
LAIATARLASPLYRLTGRRPPFTPGQLGSLTREWAFDDTRARTELGWTPRGLDQGLPPTLALFAAP